MSNNYKHTIFGSVLTTGVVKMNGVLLGSFRGGATLTIEEDRKDVMSDCNGTKPEGTYITGSEVIIAGNLVGMSIENLAIVRPDAFQDTSTAIPGSEVPALAIGTSDLTKLQEFPVTIYRCSANEVIHETVEDTINFYHGLLTFEGSIVNTGPDNEREVPIKITCRKRVFTDLEVPTSPRTLIGYAGDPSLIGPDGVPAVTHP